MVLLRSCCCWWEHNDSLKRGSYASCIYSTIIGAFQLILGGWAIYKTLWIRYSPNRDERWEPNELEYWFPPGSDAFLYIAFLFVIAKLVVGIMLWSGIEKGEYIRSKNYITAWILTNGIFQFYVLIVTVYICGYLQYYRLYLMRFFYPILARTLTSTSKNRGMVVGIWFGVVDMAVMFWAIICVISFYQQLEEYEFGMYKKTKRALWNFDLGLSVRSGSFVGTSRPPSTAYSFESLAVEQKPRSLALDTYGVNSSAV
ncbi:hypothetical protein EB796_021000 [Bugula neritina]|uniref:Uncharacterized protein n=1 Tax=Bugula neritina TaxID=10212 RepID=A0A7J7J3C2_BUGNE|nr:hypothetical protein EB796_021000 [Bugula neritina]